VSEASRASAIRFIVALGLISLFADVAYEGARSVNGPYLGQLGANAAIIGIVSGAGELAGYMLRLASGVAADRTRRYWTLTIAGYILNLVAVPALALANHWTVAAALIILERAGKALRTPPRDVMLSQASHVVGRGWGFGLHEALDQTGAFLGPLFVALVLAESHQYQRAYAILAIPVGCALASLFAAKRLYPDPSRFERSDAAPSGDGRLPSVFWLYVAAAGLVAAGIVDFPLIAYHFQKTSITSPAVTPVFYALAMGVEALSALVMGRLFDRHGVPVLMLGVLMSAAADPLVFLGSFWFALAGMALWGAGMGALQSSLRAQVATLAPRERLGSAYGIFNTAYGLLWFAGSAVAGILYERSVLAVAMFAMLAQLAALPILFVARRENA
jgi:predicted MFS family arabinose efflux permease